MIPEAPSQEAPEPLSPIEQPNGDDKQPLDLAIAMQQWAAVQSLVGAGAAAPGCRNPPPQLAAARRTIAEMLAPQGHSAGRPTAQPGTRGKPSTAPSLGQGLTAALVSVHCASPSLFSLLLSDSMERHWCSGSDYGDCTREARGKTPRNGLPHSTKFVLCLVHTG